MATTVVPLLVLCSEAFRKPLLMGFIFISKSFFNFVKTASQSWATTMKKHNIKDTNWQISYYLCHMDSFWLSQWLFQTSTGVLVFSNALFLNLFIIPQVLKTFYQGWDLILIFYIGKRKHPPLLIEEKQELLAIEI